MAFADNHNQHKPKPEEQEEALASDKDNKCCHSHHHHRHHHDDKKEHHGKQCAHEEKKEGEEASKSKQVHISEHELNHLKKELAEYKDKYLRVLAESENSRKRLQKEKQETVQFAQQNLIADFLNPIDHMENALKFTQQMSDEIKHWAAGFQMILTQFKDVLAANGVSAFASVGKPFDPHRHEAVEAVQTDKFPPGTVIEEHLKGYTMGERIIRPARVKVAKAPAQAKEEAKKNGDEIEQTGK